MADGADILRERFQLIGHSVRGCARRYTLAMGELTTIGTKTLK